LNVFCDTSALVALYLQESTAERIRDLFAEARAAAVSGIAWAEAFAAFGRRGREQPADRAALEEARAALVADWPHFVVVDVNQPLVERAGILAERFGLRGYDSVQLASAERAATVSNGPLSFACFDRTLNRAAAGLGLPTPFAAA